MGQPAFQARSNLHRTLTYRHLAEGSKQFVRVRVHEFGVTVEGRESTHEIPYHDVKEVRFHFLPYLGGWFTLVMSSGPRHRFSVMLERSEYILEMLAAAKPDAVDLEALMRYRLTAVLVDHSWARVRDNRKNRKGLLAKYLIAPPLLTALWFAGVHALADRPVPSAMEVLHVLGTMAVVNILCGTLVVSVLVEFLLVHHGWKTLKRDPSRVQRDYGFEREMALLGQIGQWLLVIGITALAVAAHGPT